MRISYLLVVVLCLTSLACTQKRRRPASFNNSKDFDLYNYVESIYELSKAPVSSTKECYQKLDDIYNKLFSLTSSEANIKNLSDKDIEEITELSFKTRLNMKSKMGQLVINNDVDKKCYQRIRDSFRAFRYLEDYLIELTSQVDNKTADDFVNLKGEAPYFMVNSKFDFKGVNDLKSGDVILSRGNAYTSAAIARIGEVDAQFSHLSFVYKDENGKLWTTEAHIEIGSVVAPIETHINQKNSRTVVFRFHDQELAHKAAKYIFERVKKQSETGKNIQYDFGMDYSEDEKLFCSEIIYVGFKEASQGQVDIPTHKTKFNPGLITFLKTMGIKVTKDNIHEFDTFGPGDIEYDSNFELVAEWRNPHKMKDSRFKDSILTMMFKWMENDGYVLKAPFGIRFKSFASWVLRRAPIVRRSLKDKFPLNMNKKQLSMFLVLDEVAEPMYQQLESAQKNANHPLSPKEHFEILEAYRLKDLEVYKEKKKDSEFHKWFHAK